MSEKIETHQIIMKNSWNGEHDVASIFAIVQCTKDEAETFCKRMNAARTSCYSDDYFVEDDYSTFDAFTINQIAEGAEEAKKRSDEINRRN